MNRFRCITLVSLCILLLLAAFPALAENPKNIHPSGYVTDLAGVIEPDTKARLEALCGEVEDKAGAQIAVVTVHSLEGESVETFAVDVYKELGVGSKRDNRGALLVVAPDEHKYRIEVGYGLEPVINDARAGDAGRAMETTAPQSRPQRGWWRNILQMIVVLRYRASLSRRRIAVSGIIRPQSAYKEYSSSSGLFSRLRGLDIELQAAAEAAVEAGGSDRCWVGWVAVGEAAVLAAARAVFPAVEDLAASVEAVAEAAGRPGVGRV